METSAEEIAVDIPDLIRIYKDGHFEKFHVPGSDIVPPGIDPSTGVNSKDVVYSPETNMFARLYIPKNATPTRKLPLLTFIHGGGFVIGTAASSLYHNFLNLLVSEANVAVVSVEYRLFPEFQLHIAYGDSWEAIKWVERHVNGIGPEPWLNEYVDFEKVFLAGDSAGANIAHQMAIRVGSNSLDGMRFQGAILLHPYFWGKERVGTESEWMEPTMIRYLDNIWDVLKPEGSPGLDDMLINPGMDPRIVSMGVSEILVCVAGDDFMRERDRNYKKLIEESGWKGKLEVVEHKGEGHVFFYNNLLSENAIALRTRVSAFINKT
uniref:probable carboxylesterase 7 n=1 Tax=Erigeron canadensis TaxID=72917 RepID=UPI001CB89558|nr:probable carboxylesterase 7 [Erigeron canadensis]